MDTSAQDFQKLLTEAIRKQMTILGPQITLLKVNSVPGLVVASDGTVTQLKDNPQATITHFLEAFRQLSSPLVRKTMQPLLSSLETIPQVTPMTQTKPNV